MPGPLLTHDELNALVNSVVDWDAEYLSYRPLLFAGIPSRYVASLDGPRSSLDQLRFDLEDMRQQPQLDGVNEPPLALWLRNAAERAQPRPEARIFREMGATVLERARKWRERPLPPPPPPKRTNWVILVIALLGLVALVVLTIKAFLPGSPPAPSPTSDRLAEADRLAGIGQREEATQIYQSLVVDSPNQRQQARLHWGRAMRDWCKRGCTAAERALGRYALSGVLPADKAYVPSFVINGSESMTPEQRAEAQALLTELYKTCPADKPWMPNGNACDTDEDNDGDLDNADNCPLVVNADQADGDGDNVGNACDNCPLGVNPGQVNSDGMGGGDICDSPLIINEFNYAEPNSDDNEFIEIVNVSNAQVALAGVELRIVGANGATLQTVNLGQINATIAAGQYMVIGDQTVLDLIDPQDGVLEALIPGQGPNHLLDTEAGFRLMNTTPVPDRIFDSVAYEGPANGTAETAPTPTDEDDHYIARCPNFTDNGRNNLDFLARLIGTGDNPTPGKANDCN